MRVYIIKHKGANYWGNYRHDTEITFPNNGGTIYAGRYFFRKKDAKKYLGEEKYKEFFEIVPFEMVSQNSV
jgi:hypothetical protein